MYGVLYSGCILMRSLDVIAFLALVAVVSAKPFFEAQSGDLAKITPIQTSIKNIGLGGQDLDVMEGKLDVLADDTTVAAAELAIKTAMDKTALLNSFNTP
jgi:hypothetical protein